MPKMGYVQTEEHRLRHSETKRRLFAEGKLAIVYSPAFLEQQGKSHCGWKHTESQKKNLSERMKGHPYWGKPFTDETKRKLSLIMKGKQNTLGHQLTIEHKQKISQGLERLWANPDRRHKLLQAILNSTHHRPTKPERELGEILTKHFPGQFAYNGDFSQGVVLNRMVPDYININGEKSVIEVFGEAFHNPDRSWRPIAYKSTEEGRARAYANLGYKCLIIWDSDFNNLNVLIDKLHNFVAGKK